VNISKSELSVLQVLWDEAPLTVGQVIERVRNTVDWHDNTVKTLLNRLRDKEAVRRYKDGRRFFYEPLVSRDAVVSEEAENLLERFFEGRIPLLVAHFADGKRLSKTDVKEMEAVLRRLKKNAD
jgi:BlaI family transcriptional regulator, penicillinase repressor